MKSTPAPSKDLMIKVRVGFIGKGTTFTGWCNQHQINPSNARQALIGSWDGPRAVALRTRIVRAAGVEASS